MAITLMAIGSCIFLGWYLGFDPEDFIPAVVDALRQSGGAMDTATDDERRAIAQLIIGLVPFVQPAVLAISLIVGLYLGAAIVRVSGRLPRPKDDIPTSAQLPQISLVIFAVAAGAAFVGGTIGLIGDVLRRWLRRRLHAGRPRGAASPNPRTPGPLSGPVLQLCGADPALLPHRPVPGDGCLRNLAAPGRSGAGRSQLIQRTKPPERTHQWTSFFSNASPSSARWARP